MRELSKTERENLDWLWTVVAEKSKYTSEFKEYALRNIEKFDKIGR